MKEPITFDDVIAYFEEASESGLLEETDFLPLLVALLRSLPAPLPDQLLAELPYLLDDAQRLQLQRLAAIANRLDDKAIAAEIREETYQAQKTPRFGRSNPERMDMAFWTFMVRRRWSAATARLEFDRAYQQHMAAFREAHEKGLDPVKMSLPPYSYRPAVWSFDRFGMSQTRLPDGRLIYIAGEHEDYYDPDFNLYNDVIVLDPDLHVTIYGYPSEVFPPTDFHTATLVDSSHIYIVGSLGYHDSRQTGKTPVYRLDCEDMRIEALSSAGDQPGWISRHTAVYVNEQNAIEVAEGEIFTGLPGEQSMQPNRKRFRLDLSTLTWSPVAPEVG